MITSGFAGRLEFSYYRLDTGAMGRTPTGETKVITFRPPKPLLERFDHVRGERDRTDALIEAMHLWLEKHEDAPSN